MPGKSKMPRYYIWTIGCQMNKSESERLDSLLGERGYQPADSADEADLILLNSCVVRQSAENRVVSKLGALRRLKRDFPHKTVALTGCMVDSNAGHLRERFPHIDYLFPPGDSPPWMDMPPHDAGAMLRHPSPRTYIPIIQGCDNFCSYCIVPYRRGRERSRPVDQITCEARELVRRGTREVILLGQNVDSYGHDLPGRPDLADLLAELNAVDGLSRIRFLTNHPKDMGDRLIEAMAGLDKVCEQVNLPVQSGSNAVLGAMRRGYTAEQYRELAARIRRRVPGVALSTDVIVGFPSETESQFRETFGLLSDLKFDTVHVAAYSPRPGTITARELEDDVPPEAKKERLARVERLQEEIAAEINSRLPGNTVEVLVEGKNKGKWHGRTRTDKPVFFADSAGYPGQIVDIEITQAGPWSLQGQIK